jgi:hypothetical protein
LDRARQPGAAPPTTGQDVKACLPRPLPRREFSKPPRARGGNARHGRPVYDVSDRIHVRGAYRPAYAISLNFELVNLGANISPGAKGSPRDSPAASGSRSTRSLLLLPSQFKPRTSTDEAAPSEIIGFQPEGAIAAVSASLLDLISSRNSKRFMFASLSQVSSAMARAPFGSLADVTR